MKTFAFAIVIFLSGSVSGQTFNNPLEIAAKASNNKLFDAYFTQWTGETKPISADELNKLNDTIRETYNVFTAFYNPITKNTHNRWFDYRKAKYLLIQDKVAVYTSDTSFYFPISEDKIEVSTQHEYLGGWKITLQRDPKKRKWLFAGHDNPIDTSAKWAKLYDTLIRFRPIIKIEDKGSLYIDSIHSRQVRTYLNATAPLLKSDSIHGANTSDLFKLMKFIDRRKKHLNKYVKVWYGFGPPFQQPYMHYDWDMPSYPKVTSLTFGPDMTIAKVEFMMMDVVGISIMKKENGQWKELAYYCQR